jgi:ribosomal protein S27E
VQTTGTQLASLAHTLAEEDFSADMAVGLLERASGTAGALESARQALVQRVARDPGDETAKAALELVDAALDQAARTSRRPVYVQCGNCRHKGAYLVADRPVVRCKYCSAVLTITDEERGRAEHDLAEFAARLG